MLKIAQLAALAILSASISSFAQAQTKPAATVNGVAIPQERVDLRIKALATQGQPDTPDLRNIVREDLVNLEVLSQEAVKKNLENQPDVVQQLELARQSVLVNAYVQDYMKTHPISDGTISQEYTKLRNSLGDKEYNVRHILVENEADAKAVAAKLKKGGNFEKLAETNSKDAGSKGRGGDLGWIATGNIATTLVKPFGDALLKLKKGQISDPVQSQFGWHIIKLEDIRDIKVAPLAEVKPQIAQKLQQQVVQKLVAELRAKASIE